LSRCIRKQNLEVHHKRRDGGNGLDNAEVLCQKCHAATSTYAIPGKTPPPFSDDTKREH
jgi:5-methylcytosine-specific restriction endonuclease McrA